MDKSTTEVHEEAPTGGKYPTCKTCEIMQEWEHMDTQSLDEVIRRIKSLSQLKTWCIITHDKDALPDGTLKKPHFHAVLTFGNTKTFKTIADTIHCQPQYVNKIRSTTLAAEMYLVHRNDPDKYQYDPKEVLANFDYVAKCAETPVRIKKEHIANKIASGEIKRYNLYKYITIDDYARNKVYFDRCFEFRADQQKGLNRDMHCIFITGASGTGKTTFAKEMATQKGYATYISSGGKNPLDNYAGEECIILDDTRSSTWSLTDFLKLTDNHTDSLVGCRYYNKSIAECKMLIVTSCKSLDEFYQNALNNDNEPKVQLLRRFEAVFHMDLDRIVLCAYDEVRQKHIPQATMINHITLRHDPKRASAFTLSLLQSMGLQVNENIDPDFPSTFSEDDLPDAWRI